jgi:adenylate cyclase
VPDVFLSYNREDQTRAKLFAEALKAAGFEVWWDVGLRTGEAYDEVTETALRQAKAVIVLWSKKSVASRWVRAEATLADRNKTLLPVMVEPCERPIMFELTQTADLSHWTGAADDKAWLAFLADVRRFVEKNRSAGDPAPKPLGPIKSEPVAQGLAARHGERRQVTVLNCALVDTDETDLDPEDWHEVVVTFQREAESVAARFGGRAAPAQGDAFIAYFGDEQAWEDDAERSVRAALAIIQHFAAAGPGRAIPFSVRVGIDTGPIVVGGAGAAAFGAALNGSARLQGRAGVGSVLISAEAANLAGGYFDLESLGGRAFHVTGVRATRTRFDVSRARGLSAFVGRAGDLRLLDDALTKAEAGQGQVIGVVAEAGTGKSRLCFEFLEQCRARGFQVFEGRAVAHGRNIPFLPILDVFRSFFGIRPEDDGTSARAKIESRSLSLDTKLKVALHLVFDFLGVGDPERPSPALHPEVRQRQLIGFMRHMMKLASAERPTVTLIEDLHWLDPASAQFLEHMVEARADTSSLLLLNFRPEFRAEWMQNSWYRQIPLAPLGREAVDELLADLLGGDASLAALTAPIQARTGGNPFFVEEVVQTLIETGQLKGLRGAYRLVTPVAKLEVPPTVRAILAARIDRLGERERRVLQTASVIGKEFSEPFLAAVADLPASELAAALAALRRAEFIHEQSLFPVAEFAFKHPLTQEVALGSLLKDRRRQIHAAVARAIEAQDPDHLDERAALLAHHWEEAGENLAAARWHRRAGQWATRTDIAVATRHWERIRELLKSASNDPESVALGIATCSELLLMSWRTETEVERLQALLAEGQALASSIGDRSGSLRLSLAFSRAFCARGDVARSLDLARDVYQASLLTDDKGVQAYASAYVAEALCFSGRFPEALELLESAASRFKDLTLPAEEQLNSMDPSLLGFYRGPCLGWLGRRQEALAQQDQYRQAVERVGLAEIVAYVDSFEAEIHYHAHDAERALACANRLDEICRQLGAPQVPVSHGHMAFAFAHLAAGAGADAVAAARIAVDMHSRVEKQLIGMSSALLAAALLQTGDLTAAQSAAETAIAHCRRLPFGGTEIEAHGILARVLMRRDGTAAREVVEAELACAAELIERTGARALAPWLLEWRAELAELLGDDAGRIALLNQASALYVEIGAPLGAERVREILG